MMDNATGEKIADGLMAIAESLAEVSLAIHKLGFNDANTKMGAIEGLAMQVRDGFALLSQSIPDMEELRVILGKEDE